MLKNNPLLLLVHSIHVVSSAFLDPLVLFHLEVFHLPVIRYFDGSGSLVLLLQIIEHEAILQFDERVAVVSYLLTAHLHFFLLFLAVLLQRLLSLLSLPKITNLHGSDGTLSLQILLLYLLLLTFLILANLHDLAGLLASLLNLQKYFLLV